jgi:hypothetical protein
MSISELNPSTASRESKKLPVHLRRVRVDNTARLGRPTRHGDEVEVDDLKWRNLNLRSWPRNSRRSSRCGPRIVDRSQSEFRTNCPRSRPAYRTSRHHPCRLAIKPDAGGAFEHLAQVADARAVARQRMAQLVSRAKDAARRLAEYVAGTAKQPVEAPPQKPVGARKPVLAPPLKPADASKPVEAQSRAGPRRKRTSGPRSARDRQATPWPCRSESRSRTAPTGRASLIGRAGVATLDGPLTNINAYGSFGAPGFAKFQSIRVDRSESVVRECWGGSNQSSRLP